MLNKVILQGRLGADPELRTTPNGVEVATVNIAVDRDRKDQNGERQTDWVTIVAWRNTAKFLSQYFTKGRMILVEGRLQIRNYTDREGNKRTAAEVVADNVHFGDSQKQEDPINGLVKNMGGTTYSADDYGTPPTDNFAELSENDGELPF